MWLSQESSRVRAVITECLSDLKSHRKNSALPSHLGSAVLKIYIFLCLKAYFVRLSRSIILNRALSSPTKGVESGSGGGTSLRLPQGFAFYLYLLVRRGPVEDSSVAHGQ